MRQGSRGTLGSGVALAALAFLLLFSAPQAALATHCDNVQSSATGNLFDTYEQVEYSPDGWLIVHLKVRPSFNEGQGWRFFVNVWNDTCNLGTRISYETTQSLPAGTAFWSIRFTSPTTYEIWDDDSEALVTSRTIDLYPGYFEVSFGGRTFVSFNGSTFTTKSYRIRNDASDPPVRTETIEPLEVCAAQEPFVATGYFFDEYESTEYASELIHWYLRLKSPFNDGRAWWNSGTHFYNESCGFIGSVSSGGGSLEPYSRYYSVRFTSPTTYEVWNDELGTLRKSVDLTGQVPTGARFASFWATIDGDASRIRTTPFPISESDYLGEPDPVIIIPGILGSWKKNGEWVIDPVLHVYDNLIETFELNNFVQGENLFPFPYDWRESNIFTAGLLRNKINKVQEVCECEKVDIIAHSMGGLIARYYIQSGLYEDDIDQLIFLGTPHLGSPKSYLTWEGGELNEDTSTSVLETRILIQAWLEGFDSIFDYVQNRPVVSVRQLLPIFDYLRDTNTGILREYPSDYPQNTFLEELNANVANLFSSGIDITNIIGNLGENSTIGAFRVIPSPILPNWKFGYPENFDEDFGDRGIERGIGDGTVTLESASFITNNLMEFPSEHKAIVKDSQTVVFEKLTGNEPEEVSMENFDASAIAFIRVLSPIDILVTTPSGERIGRNFSNGEEVNEIAGAFYSGFLTDDEYITIPDPINSGEYLIQTRGTDNGGKYTIAIRYITDGAILKNEISSYILPETDENIVFNFETLENLEIEETTVVTLEILIEHIEQASELGWITDIDYKTNLQNILQSAINSEESNFDSVVKVFQKRLSNGYKDGFINENGYNLLVEDVNLLLKI